MPSVSIHTGLTGWPLEHSLSPAIHSAGLQEHGLKGDYRLFPCPPGDEGAAELVNLLKRVRVGELNGLNVTIPYKEKVLELMDELTPLAASLGAVNTISLRNGKLVGDNTDGPGFLADLLDPISGAPPIQTPTEGEIALILGAGGGGRAAIGALSCLGMKVYIAARNIKQSQVIAEELGGQPYSPARMGLTRALPMEEKSLRQLSPALIVNCTPLGMFPDIESSPWPSSLPLPSGVAIYDMVYNPPETVLVRDAKKAGLQAVGGLGMLIEQAALSFEIWTGLEAPRKAMYSAALNAFGVLSSQINHRKDAL
jgi:shikimate dehydrogenase